MSKETEGRIGEEYPAEDYIKALKIIRFNDEIPDSVQKMLQVHYHAPERKMTPVQLADAAGYKDFYAVNLHYGKLGQQICEEIGYDPVTVSGRTVWTCGVAWGEREESEGDWIWTMYPNLAAALKELAIVS